MDVPQDAVESRRPERRSHTLVFPLAYFVLGVTVGFLAGVSSAEVTLPIMAALLSLIGVSTLVLLQKLAVEQRGQLGLILLFFCLGLILSLPLGIAVKVNRWLTFEQAAAVQVAVKAEEVGVAGAMEPASLTYLKGNKDGRASVAETLCRQNDLVTLREFVSGLSTN